MTTRKIGRSVRAITREALTRGTLDRAAVRRVTGEAAKFAATTGATSAAMAMRIAAGILAGVADTLAQKRPRHKAR